ncbi:DUF6350 family protein [Jatrophihabitans sp.]|uniref:cell division protein PerM n=1 Tax=Jatrophihabitans sp. TaxID=1932789 RepID=UPI002C76FC1C|nr:DUF6350 family protein [Jatrophihabitans sp.]
MSSTDQQYPPGWLTRFRRGVGSGVAVLLIALGGCAVACYAAWLMPGADTATATSALKAAALVLLAGGHGGLVLAGTPVSLAPLLVTALLGWLVAAHARRQDSWSGFAGLTAGYVTASAVLASWSRLGSTHAPVLRSALASAVFVLAVGGTARGAEQLWSRLPARWQQVSRAAGLAAAGYLAAGALLAAGTLVVRFSDAVALQRQLAPGPAGLPVALLGISATPNAVLAAVGYLTGTGFGVGAATSVSPLSVSSGRVPVFPLLAGLPHQQPPAWLAVLVVLLPALLAGWAVLRTVTAAHSWTGRLADCAAAAALAGIVLAALTGLAAGDLGRGGLRGIGATWWAVGPSAALLVLLGAACWLGVEALRDRLARPAAPGLYALPGDAEPEVEPAPRPAARTEEPAARSRTAS